MDVYFQRHDGQAVTCDDFVRAMEDANGFDLSQFRRWYSQAGTPELFIDSEYNAGKHCLELTVRQACPPTPGQVVKEPLHIPLALGLLGPDGIDYPLQLEGETAPGTATRILEVKDAKQSFRFVNLPCKPVISALRGFSAPVRLHLHHSYEELAFLLAHDSDPFNRWDAGQTLACRIILNMVEQIIEGERPNKADSHIINAYRKALTQDFDDLSYLALLLTLPSEEYVSAMMKIIDPGAVHAARRKLRHEIAANLGGELLALYESNHRDEPERSDARAIGRRSLKNLCLQFLSELDTEAAQGLCVRQFREARNMTDQIAALSCMVNSHNPEKQRCLDAYYAQWQDEDLVVDKWFALQASCHLPGVLDSVQSLLGHPAFDLSIPNRVRSVIGAFSQNNPVNFHASNGAGYRFLADYVIVLNGVNPQIAARMVGGLTHWRRYDEGRQILMQEQLQRIAGSEGISKDVYEVATKSLA
jgi:aminopeptidase N